MSEIYSPFLKWSGFTSKDEKHPDVIEIEPLEIETFETEYSVNLKAKVNEEEKIIPLHNFNSQNKQLLQKWNNAIQTGKAKVGRKFKLLTWLGISKNKFPIRRFELVF